MRTKNTIITFLFAGIISFIAIACNARTETTAKVNVDKDIVVAIYSTIENGDSLNVVPHCLLEERVHIAELCRYPEDGGITMPFTLSDTAKYAEITGNNLEKRIAISVNGQIVSTPVVTMRIENGACSVVLDEAQSKVLFPDVDMQELKLTSN